MTIGNILKNIFGTVNGRFINSAETLISRINEYESTVSVMSDSELIAQTSAWKEQVANGMPLDDLLIPAFASVRETAKRRLGMRHFDVQLMGGIALHQGMIAEMKTGEGKTLVATLACYLNALTGKGVHLVTVNDYLAARDSEWMGEVYKALGLTVGCIKHGITDEERKQAYGADITYGTSNEFGFDYLRDNMKHTRDSMVQRELSYAIVDEADFVLIDEARTPLIISGMTAKATDVYVKCDAVIQDLPPEAYEIDRNHFTAMLTEEGIEITETMLRDRGLIGSDEHLYDVNHITLLHHIHQALKANTLYTKDKDYIIKDDRIIIIDEFTGRMMEGRRYSDGLHQALEAKEGVEINSENTILASITFQNYFRLYKKLAGMTGTAATEAAELQDIYNLAVREIPANLPVRRIDENDAVYLKTEDKYAAMIETVKKAHEKGQPILIGTSSISKSEHISNLLKSHGLSSHNVLNAKHHESEAYIIAQAGIKSAITIATNMAGRGTDIQLGGNVEMMLKTHPNFSRPEIEAKVTRDKKDVIAAGGLFVIGTERHDSRRIDNQLRGRSGRQGDPGRSKFFISLEDDLMHTVGMEKMSGVFSKLGMSGSDAIEHNLVSKSIERAQKKIEERNYSIRKTVVKYDDAIDKQRKIIFGQRNKVIDSTNEIIATFDYIRQNVNAKIINGHTTASTDRDKIADDLTAEFFNIYSLRIEFAEEKEDAKFTALALEKVNKITKEFFGSKISEHSADIIAKIQKQIWLVTLDGLWRDHLLALDFLRNGISLRSVGQRDPLNEFAMEAFKMFDEMLDTMETAVIRRFSHIEPHNKERERVVIHISGNLSIDGRQFNSIADAIRDNTKIVIDNNILNRNDDYIKIMDADTIASEDEERDK